MSFINREVDESLCDQCEYKFSAYMDGYGVFSPCLTCDEGNEAVIKQEKRRNKNEFIFNISN